MLVHLNGFMRVFMRVMTIFRLMFRVQRLTMVMVVGVGRLRRLAAGVFHDLALDALATAAAARIAMARPTAIRAVLGLLFGLAVGPFLRLDQGLAIGNRDLIVVGMDFAKSQKAMAVAAIFDEGGLQ